MHLFPCPPSLCRPSIFSCSLSPIVQSIIFHFSITTLSTRVHITRSPWQFTDNLNNVLFHVFICSLVSSRTDRLLHCGYGKRVLSRRSSIVIVHHRSRHRTASIVDHSLLIEINVRSRNGVFDATFSCLCSTTSTMHP